MDDKPADGETNELLRKLKSQMEGVLANPAATDIPPPAPTPANDNFDKQVNASQKMIRTVNAFARVEDLPPPTKEESVEEAHKILRWLRNMEFADRDVEQWLDGSAPKVAAAKKEALQKLINIVVLQLNQARLKNSQLKNDASIDNAADAMNAIALTVAEHTFNLLPDDYPKLKELEDQIDDMPERALMRQSQSLEHLLNTMELGLERATGKEISGMSAASRLMVVGEQVQKTAYQLHNNPAPEPPTREESFDLARDILRKLQGMPLAAMPVKDLIETGKPEDKAAFATAIAELADLYRNLMAEAVELNPKLLEDMSIRRANDAVGQFAYSIKLMAAKEIPSSAAATQQISAEVAQMPEHWGELHDRTVDRLVKNAQEGLEKAMDELAAAQEMQQEEEMAQEAVEQALQHSDKKRKKKRRGESKSRSGKGGKKQLKKHLDITADDYVLKQGRFAVDAQAARHGHEDGLPRSAPPIPGLNPGDLQAIKALGGSLRDIGNQLKGLATTVTTVSANDKILPSPNEQSVAQRILDAAEQQKPHNPRGSGGPGV